MSSIQIRPELKMDVMHWELASSNGNHWFNMVQQIVLLFELSNHSSPILSQQLIFLHQIVIFQRSMDNVLIPIFWLLQTRHGGNLLCQIQDKSAVHISTNRSPTDGKCLSVSTAEVPVLLDFGNCIRLPEEQRCLDMCFFY